MAVWSKITSRGDVEDRRSMSPVALGGGASVVGVIAYLLFTLLSGGRINVNDVLTQLQDVPVQQQNANKSQYEGQDNYEVFASTVLGSNNDMWSKTFIKMNKKYNPPKLVLFRQATQSGCGVVTSEVGPNYCPIDKVIYLDETFFNELKTRFGAQGGDVAEAYIIAHEAGHHAQNELGIMSKVQSQGEDNSLSVKLELQADCFAGLWLNSIKDAGVYQPQEIYEAMDAASVVGDDRIQKKTTGRINPETWTHGSSEQRVSWFNKGYESGQLAQCNTFK